ncbi:hypothetical protein [Streptomyces qinglanensis]|uniref:hypothetical protein n=1 Tax=Streptomyces qinglanensis TaxID=943816 RepID=UPI0037B5B0D8
MRAAFGFCALAVAGLVATAMLAETEAATLWATVAAAAATLAGVAVTVRGTGGAPAVRGSAPEPRRAEGEAAPEGPGSSGPNRSGNGGIDVRTRDVGGQIVAGDGNTVVQGVQPPSAREHGLSRAQRSVLRAELAGLRARLTDLPGEVVRPAVDLLQELEDTVAGPCPEPDVIAAAYDWFRDHLPELADALGELLARPAVRAHVCGDSETSAAALARRLGCGEAER